MSSYCMPLRKLAYLSLYVLRTHISSSRSSLSFACACFVFKITRVIYIVRAGERGGEKEKERAGVSRLGAGGEGMQVARVFESPHVEMGLGGGGFVLGFALLHRVDQLLAHTRHEAEGARARLRIGAAVAKHRVRLSGA